MALKRILLGDIEMISGFNCYNIVGNIKAKAPQRPLGHDFLAAEM